MPSFIKASSRIEICTGTENFPSLFFKMNLLPIWNVYKSEIDFKLIKMEVRIWKILKRCCRTVGVRWSGS